VLADLQGPKIRIDRFKEGKVFLKEGGRFVLDAKLDANAGTVERVGIAYKALVDDVNRGDTLLLDDGAVVLWVEEVKGNEIDTRVVVGSTLSNNKSINRQGDRLSALAITDKDRADIKVAAEMQADYIAVSFPRHAADINEARELLRKSGGHGGIIAKIERAEAMNALEEIIGAADVVMIARGDLGVEIGDANLPAVQKEIIRKARHLNCVTITATQMMESMRDNPIPTRAEVFDVANAVLDGTDAVMLSAETATGTYPSETVRAMSDICLNAELQSRAIKSRHRLDDTFDQVDEAIAMAAMYTANHLDARAIATLTESGSTSLWMSRISSGIPIYALSRHESTNRKVNLYRGVFPVYFPTIHTNHAEANQEAVDLIITKGDLMGTGGGTNAMKIVEVGNMPSFVA
jgi:pyruvate kinase